jgi:WD40 repeat protein
VNPYLTIIKDCFHEAFVSRVLWIVLGLITLLLAGLAPLSVNEQPAVKVRVQEVFAPQQFLTQIARTAYQSAQSPGAVIWELLEDDEKNAINEVITAEEEDRRAIRASLVTVLNTINEIDDPGEIYNAGAFSTVTPHDDAQELLDRLVDGLNDEEGRRLNRFLVGAAFPRAIFLRNAVDTRVGYFIWGDDIDAIPIPRDEILNTAMTGITRFLLGTLGVMLAILITATMIPQTFEKGAIDLLLSKPLNRPLLFLAKYFGGCAFILINATYLVGGLCLLAGLRWGYWQPRMLLGIPIFLFLFGIYYSISAIAGVIWRNAVICVFLTVAFWAMCFFVGTSRNVVQDFFLTPSQASTILPLESPVVRSESNSIVRWDDEDADEPWLPLDDVSKSSGLTGPFSSLTGPVYDKDQYRMIFLRTFAGERGNQAATILGGPESDWILDDGPVLNDRPQGIHTDNNGGITVTGRRGMQRLSVGPDGKEYYENIGPGIEMAPPTSVSLDPVTRRLAIWDGKKLSVYTLSDTGKYELENERNIETLGQGLASFQHETIAIATKEGDLVAINATNLEEVHSFNLPYESTPRYIAASPDGRWRAIVYHDGRLRLADLQDGTWSEPRIPERNTISAVAFADDGDLWVSGRYRRISTYDPETMRSVKRYRPPLMTLEKIERYAIEPIYTIFPKPGELSDVITYLMTGEESIVGVSDDLAVRRAKSSLWGTVWSNLAFLTVMLALACIHIQRKDF